MSKITQRTEVSLQCGIKVSENEKEILKKKKISIKPTRKRYLMFRELFLGCLSISIINLTNQLSLLKIKKKRKDIQQS